jgi:hypothetical protein
LFFVEDVHGAFPFQERVRQKNLAITYLPNATGLFEAGASEDEAGFDKNLWRLTQHNPDKAEGPDRG